MKRREKEIALFYDTLFKTPEEWKVVVSVVNTQE